jgi:hypothetical protein
MRGILPGCSTACGETRNSVGRGTSKPLLLVQNVRMPVVELQTGPDRESPPSPAHARAYVERVATAAREHPWLVVVALAVLACLLGRVPFMGRPLSPDEGGLLMVARQWSPGDSLYGDYWVDRPPVLIAIFALADLFGGPWGLRALGVLAVLASVLLAGLLGRVVAPQLRTAALLPAATAALLLATPLFGASVVDAEVLGLPLVLAGMVAAVASSRAESPRVALWWGLAAGAAGAGAALTKQNLLDVFVLVLALLVIRGPGGIRPRVAAVLGTALGAGAVVAGAVAVSTALGTSPGELWQAVVTFRGEATRVLLESPASADRLLKMLLALLGSGAPLLAVVLLLGLRRRRHMAPGHTELRWPVVAVLVWEAFAVLMGGSYWLHYLTGLVPGLVLLAAVSGLPERLGGPVAERSRRHAPFAIAYAYAALSTLCVIGWVAVHPPDRSSPQAVASYLEARAQPGDTAVVAFGVPSILQASGLESPYPDLWSLPVRVRDPQLLGLAALLSGPDRPTWLVISGTSLWTWGVDPAAAQPYVDTHYVHMDDVAGYAIYRKSETTS